MTLIGKLRNGHLLEGLAESFFVEADDQLLTDSQNRSSQRSRAAQNQSSDFVFVVLFLQIKVDELLSSRHVKFFHPVQQLERVIAFVSNFAGVDFLDGVDTVVRKKLLRFFAGRSARSVIAPVNFRHHLFPYEFVCKETRVKRVAGRATRL